MKTNVTFNSQKFETLNVPQLNLTHIKHFKLPNLKLNTTYYKLKENSLQAFRILAIALNSSMYGTYQLNRFVSYLVQLPNKEPIWVNNFITENSIVFENYDKYISYMQGDKNVNVTKSDNWYSSQNHIQELNNYDYRTDTIKSSWCINKNTKQPCAKDTKIKYFLLLENSLEICLKHEEEFYLTKGETFFNTKEECIAYHLNGFTIDDFAEEVQEISIKVLPNKPTRKTIHVIEVENE